MILELDQILSPEECNSIRNGLESARFVDGKLTAGPGAQDVKNNLQMDINQSEHGAAIEQLIFQAIGRYPLIHAALLPRAFSNVTISRYEVGMSYGPHVDVPVMGNQSPLRSDMSMTIFLDEPEDYDGGELNIHAFGREQKFKLARGNAVVYPTYFLHEVAEVTRGRRTAAVVWMQSAVRDPLKREILFELNSAQSQLTEASPNGESTRRVRNAYANLLRMWGEV